MLYRTYSVTLIGVEVVEITIEVSVGNGVGIYLVGLPDSAVKESLLRVTTALQRYEFRIPGRKIVINMAPADIRKEGSIYDAAIAVGLLAASEQIAPFESQDFLIMGELSLDGLMRPVKGSLPVAINASAMGYKSCIFPYESAKEAKDVDGVNVYGVKDFMELLQVLRGEEAAKPFLVDRGDVTMDVPNYLYDFKDVKGQPFAKRGFEIAAAGGHNIILSGSPGSGKSFMSACLPSILPPMSRKEAMETSVIYSVSGVNSVLSEGLLRQRPMRSPHHTASVVSLVGGGPNAVPGEISLAHNGVLYLDELPQFSAHTLDILRQPLEDRKISISRARYKVTYPSSFMLVGSMNPCPCGYAGDENGRCVCTEGVINRYKSRLSGPLIDRIDLFVNVQPVPREMLLSEVAEEASEAIALRVKQARDAQQERFKDLQYSCHTNAQMSQRELKQFCVVDRECAPVLSELIDRYSLSARAYNRVLKVARTIADLKGEENISLSNILEAVQYRFN